MFRKKIHRPLPDGAKLIAPGRVRVQIAGKWVDRKLSPSGKMIDLSAKWYAWVVEGGKRKAIALDTDRSASLQILARRRKSASRRAENLEPTETNDPRQPLADLAGEWFGELSASGMSEAQLRNNRPRLSRVLKLSGLATLADLLAPDLPARLRGAVAKLRAPRAFTLPKGERFNVTQARVILGIAQASFWDMRDTTGIQGDGRPGKARSFSREEMQRLCAHRWRGLSPKTVNATMVVFKSFTWWLYRRGSCPVLVAVPKALDEKAGRRLVRRAITWEECQTLAKAARDSGRTVSGATPETREALYLTAFVTLLRSRALRELVVSDLHLDGDSPWVSVRAETDKTGKARGVPIIPEVAGKIRALVRGRKKTDRVFLFDYRTMAAGMRHDLRLAGIPFRTGEGQLDLHALRHSGATFWATRGLDLFSLTKLGGWGSTKEIIATYGHLMPQDLGEKLGRAFQ